MRAKQFMALAVLLLTGLVQVHAAPDADHIYTNAKIYTLDPNRPWAEAIAVRDGRIVAVGDTREVLAGRGADTRVEDLGGAMVLPGLIDAHVHPLKGGIKTLYECNFPFSATPKDVASTVAACVRDNPDAVWIRGGQWDSAFFDRFDVPSPKQLLDEVSGDKAVVLSDDSGHNAWLNSKALSLMGITADTPNPADGTIVRLDGGSEPNGLLLEGPAQAVEALLPEWTLPQLLEGARESVRIANSFGITAMKSAMAPESVLKAFNTLDSRGELKAHIALSILTPYGSRKSPLNYDDYSVLRDRYRSADVDTRFIKIFMDGVPTPSRTAAMLAPYTAESPGAERTRGPMHLSSEQLASDLIAFDKRGFTVKIHTAGDRSVRVALDAIEAARKANGNSGLRHELAHAGFIDPDDIARFAELGAVADLSPFLWHPSPIIDSVISAVGPRGEHYFPIKTLLEAKAPVLAGSDWPAAVETIDPWLGIEAMVTRHHPRNAAAGELWPEQAITLEQAIAIFTVDNARALRLEEEAGSLEAGKSADFVVLSENLFDIAPESISDVRVLRTVFKGQSVYLREAGGR
ncbi:amidohydrolase [Parahaliea mediterranea]|uniref:Amidohydrolase n=1 Tax=Parahaliea mediterranea TaxID=651086 RepID=A0A939DH26_9GAMM|nr:amidohydrolase [Parahaliea mediterranea]MBN7797337.1 amidohydrolase [Parahaliea mediterranea]